MPNEYCRWCGQMITSWNHHQHGRNCRQRPTCDREGCAETARGRYCYEHEEADDGE